VDGFSSFQEGEVAGAPSEVGHENALQGLFGGNVALFEVIKQGALRFVHEIREAEASLPGRFPEGGPEGPVRLAGNAEQNLPSGRLQVEMLFSRTGEHGGQKIGCGGSCGFRAGQVRLEIRAQAQGPPLFR
jgi:hypothetical protein